MASPIISGTMMSNPCPSTFLDKNRVVAAELNITNNEKKYSPGSNFAKWMLQEIKRLIANIMSGSRSVNTETLTIFTLCQALKIMVIVPGWRQLERMSISK
ncbi:hypothetical protein V9V59_001675 [Escherichia coli]|uniref:hypothetical protein n=1 Tax=Escherichia coli TaxID=562 RepID=UPI00189C476C|nr:hypothetical protein [Escherichia coli]EIH7475605.1 hypothetical protein [Escherichia coli]EIZ8522410.1 hypothetical protein [Escherichia coli]EKN2745962.1 hypothetical protein [Escherichia coli]ELG8912824.1 hypothetical protein [Escherichia coli]MCN3510878.1 hypothetical protein [Escherichia coli]